MPAEQIHDIGRRRAWAIWAVALSVYILAVFHRSSLGVAGLLAAERFHIAATQLAFFTVLQLLVYAGMQIPVGLLLDRYGAKRMLLTGLVLMTAGQLAFAFATSFATAVPARAVLGAGDAMVFVSVLRLVTAWFLVRQAPMVTQLTGQLGQLGAIAAAGPLALALDRLGWTRTFAMASSVGLVLPPKAPLPPDCWSQNLCPRRHDLRHRSYAAIAATSARLLKTRREAGFPYLPVEPHHLNQTHCRKEHWQPRPRPIALAIQACRS